MRGSLLVSSASVVVTEVTPLSRRPLTIGYKDWHSEHFPIVSLAFLAWLLARRSSLTRLLCGRDAAELD